jgi:alkylated DNA repair dioxygenase AlkB
MNTLFDVAPQFPEGFSYVDNFIATAEETFLLECISKLELHQFNFQGYTAHRKVASFGYDYSFDNRKLTKGKPFPEEFNSLVNKVANHLHIDVTEFAELLVTEYPVGAVINWHRDAPPFDLIAGISLKSDCTFRLRPHEKEKQGRGSNISFPVRRRSLYIMQRASRSEWQHSIQPVKQVRYSITLRTLKQGHS